MGKTDPSPFSTGFPALDALLPEGGLPGGALTELLVDHQGIGALSLLMPLFARLNQAGRWLLWIAPPYIPYAPALISHGVDLSKLLVVRIHAPAGPKEGRQKEARQKEVLWALEQALRFELCGAAIGWLNEVPNLALRRLQLAAEAGGGCAILYRPTRVARQASPAALRLRLAPGATGLQVQVLKCRGGWGGRSCEL